ncbi:SGNH/GDSL hydrolase family protein [Rhodococcus tukisamuensis]|nr:SGNH/GDSL hydrolase family protein [Rhodococcus tukisamuensis]
MISRATRSGATAAATLCLLAAAGNAGAAPLDAGRIDYVAIGDSAAAGPLLPDQDMSAPGCLRSHLNYPAVVAAELGATLTDVSCSSARTANITNTPQRTFSGTATPQLDALNRDTDLVTVTIGANDFNLFTTALSCANPLPQPTGSSCRDKFNAGGRNQQRDQIAGWAPTWGAMLDQVRERAPYAEIAVVGYGTYLRPGGCPAQQPIWSQDADYLQSVMTDANAAMEAEATRRGIRFVDITQATSGHDICAAPGQAAYTGLVPTEPAVPLHPTVFGMQAIGAQVAEQLR